MVELVREGGVARIFLNRPQKVNALDSALLDALAATLASLSSDSSLRVVVLAGRGRAFCGGADVNEMAQLDASSAREFITRIHRACDAIRRLPVPVVAQLHGVVIGAGLELALKTLAPQDRLRMGYYYRHELSLKEIGRLMGEHESTVSRKLARTRHQLKNEIERRLREIDMLSQDQIRLCYDFAAGDLQFDLTRALPDIQ